MMVMKKGSEINKECFSISSFPSLSLDYWTQIRIYEWIEIRCIISSEFSEISFILSDSLESFLGYFTKFR